MKKAFKIIGYILIIFSFIYFAQGFDKKDNYSYSEYTPSSAKNAYVGGDAYNYIINANYFTGYIVLGSGLMISGFISLVLSEIIQEKNKIEANKENEVLNQF